MNTKRKIEDYKDKKVAIHCSSKEEWDKIVDLFDNLTVKKHYWENFINGGKSDTIRITGRGWSPKEYFIKKQYTIYPASDFLEEVKSISKEDLVKGEIYLYDNAHIAIYPKGGNIHLNSNSFTPEREWAWSLDIKNTTPEQKHWLNECIKVNKFIPYDEAMKSFFELPYKFNIGDEIKAKPGGYYLCDPKSFAEHYKMSFPSERSAISGKITERTQAQGFNWYRCGHGNWITEEGIELVERYPEYVECIESNKDRFTIGKIYKVEEVINERMILFDDAGLNRSTVGYPMNGGIWKFKPSTKEAYDLQKIKPKVEMLPYPTDKKYFKAVVTKDIHKKDLVTRGNMPELIPKGYQTWFDNKYLEVIENKKKSGILCPENNRWSANIPAKYFEIVEDEKTFKFEEGKWYKFSSYSKNSNTNYAKLEKFSGGIFYSKNWIHSEKFNGSGSWYISSIFDPILLTDLSEIQQYLPEGHPDKFKIETPINKVENHTSFKVGDYITVIGAETNKSKFIGDVLKIAEILNEREYGLWFKHFPESFSGGGFRYNVYKDKIRRSTPEEIKNSLILSQYPLTPEQCFKTKPLIKNRNPIVKETIKNRNRLEIKPIKQTIKLKHYVNI